MANSLPSLVAPLWLLLAALMAVEADSALAGEIGPKTRDTLGDEVTAAGGYHWPAAGGWFEMSLGGGFGLGGWTDTALEDSGETRAVRHSILGGFVGTVGVGVKFSDDAGAMLRIGLGGGAFSYRRPSDGPEPANAFTIPTKDSTYGRFSFAVGFRVETAVVPGLRFAVQAGPMAVIPMTELWTYRRTTDSFTTQDYLITYDLAGGAFAEILLLWAIEPGVSLRLGVVAEVAHLAWRHISRRRGSGAYAPFSPATFEGTIRISDDAPTAMVSPTVNNFDLSRTPADSDAIGLQALLALTIGVAVEF